MNDKALINNINDIINKMKDMIINKCDSEDILKEKNKLDKLLNEYIKRFK